jgi:hypothetical protein
MEDTAGLTMIRKGGLGNLEKIKKKIKKCAWSHGV